MGRASDSPSEFFKGDIFYVAVYNYALSTSEAASLTHLGATVRQAASLQNEALSPGGERRSKDGRLCLSPCSAEEPPSPTAFAAKADLKQKAVIPLSCDDTGFLSQFNGPTRSRFRVSCPSNCQRSKAPVRGSRVYAPQSSVCKAALHAGMLDVEGGEVMLVLHNGIEKYKGSRGMHGGSDITTRFSFSLASEIAWQELKVSQRPKLNCARFLFSPHRPSSD